MPAIPHKKIPDWLYREVDEYFIPLPFAPATVLDIGANVGAFAQRARERWPEAKIICCEPMPFNVVQLRRNVSGRTAIISAAVRSFSGVDAIHVGENFVTGGFVDLGRHGKDTLLVECIAAAALPSCEVVKIDTEGCEVEILQGLSLKKTRALFVEHHSRADAEAILALLAPDFRLANADSGEPVGTFLFLRA